MGFSFSFFQNKRQSTQREQHLFLFQDNMNNIITNNSIII